MDDDVRCEFNDLVLPSFQYRSIQPGWIRILDLLNEPYDQKPLQCRLRQVKLQSPEADYNALSYVWGDDCTRFKMQAVEQSPESSSVNIGTIPLTKSLRNALHDLRDCEKIQPKTFWIDQVCIDQGNDDEKSHQVFQMGKVFQYATHVWTYLGPREEAGDEALDLLARIYDHFEPLTRTSDQSDFASLLLDKDLIDNVKVVQMYRRMLRKDTPACLLFPEDLFADHNFQVLKHLGHLLGFGPWTERLWLFQENVLNHSTGFFRGHRTLSWKTMELICKLSFVGLVPWITGTRHVVYMARQRCVRHGQEPSKAAKTGFHLRDLLLSTSLLEYRDPKDKIYAILGIATDTKQLNVYPDYAISTPQAFTRLSVAILRNAFERKLHKPLGILADASRGVSLETSRGLMPTWVCAYIDWGYLGRNRADVNASQTEAIHAAYELSAQFKFEPAPGVENGVLLVEGMRLDLTMSRSLGTFPGLLLRYELSMEDLFQALGVFESIEKFAAGANHVLSRVFETLMMDRYALESNIELAEEEAASQILYDILQLLRQAKDGDRIPDRNSKGHFFLPVSHLRGGANSPAHKFIKQSESIRWRSVWVSKTQHVCLAPNRVQRNDIAVILFGGDYIYYLRPVGGDRFQYIGWGYIAGFMHGEPFQDGWEDKVETFRII